MSSRRLASSRTAALTPLGTSGQRAFEVIRREASALGPEYEALFAEPFISPEGDTIDWYATGTGAATPLSVADDARRAEGRARLDALVAGLAAKADALSRDADPERRRLGEALRNAVEIPDENSVYLVGDQPVLINWAHRANVAQAPSGVLTARLAAPVAPAARPLAAASAPVERPVVAPEQAAPAPPAGPRGFGWLWWLLWGAVSGLAAAITLLLLPACGVSGPSWLNWCPPPAQTAPPESFRAQDLRAELDRLQRDLLDRDAACRPPALACVAPPAETVLLLDISTSMEFGVRSPAEIDRELSAISARAAPSGEFASQADARRYAELVERAMSPDMGEARFSALRRALGSAFAAAEPLNLRVGPFATCNSLELSSPITDSVAARGFVDRLELKSYTALAFAISRAATLLRGGRTADDPVNMLVISDGFDTCGGDPCAAARTAKAARPGLQIDVVDLVGLPELRCVAQETGGRYVASPGGVEPSVLSTLLSEAGARSRPAICRPESFEGLLPQSPRGEDRADRGAEEFDRRVEEAGGADGAVRVTLIWDTISDLDLAVRCPSGGTIMFSNPRACGGVLDVDRNARGPVDRPVENVVFSDAVAPGRYQITVTNYDPRGVGTSPFQVRVEKGGRAEIHSGSLRRKGQFATFEFTYP